MLQSLLVVGHAVEMLSLMDFKCNQNAAVCTALVALGKSSFIVVGENLLHSDLCVIFVIICVVFSLPNGIFIYFIFMI